MLRALEGGGLKEEEGGGGWMTTAMCVPNLVKLGALEARIFVCEYFLLYWLLT